MSDIADIDDQYYYCTYILYIFIVNFPCLPRRNPEKSSKGYLALKATELRFVDEQRKDFTIQHNFAHYVRHSTITS